MFNISTETMRRFSVRNDGTISVSRSLIGVWRWISEDNKAVILNLVSIICSNQTQRRKHCIGFIVYHPIHPAFINHIFIHPMNEKKQNYNIIERMRVSNN